MQSQKRNELILAAAFVALFVLLGTAAITMAPAIEKWVADRDQTSGETPLRLLVTSTDRRKIENGNELVMIEGRIVNPTDRRLRVPLLTAELRARDGSVIHRWTIAPPVTQLDARGSVDFRNAELNVPPKGDQLTLTIGSP
jgi:hypothetical protein